MGRLEDLATEHHTDARWNLGEALNRIACADDGGSCKAEDLARIANAFNTCSWWQQVTDLTHDGETDGGTAILRVRQHAERYLIDARPIVYGTLFAQAMAESRRHGAQAFLNATQNLADALATPTRREPSCSTGDAAGAHTAPAPDAEAGPDADQPGTAKEYRP